ncbi:MAG: T9SS type A sorting domain-containing protein [Bacteroidota bacterium]
MKIHKLLLGTSAIALSLAIFIFALFLQNRDTTQKYVPRDKREINNNYHKPTRGIAGALKYYDERRKNVKTGKIELKDMLKTQLEVEAFARQKKSSSALDLVWHEMGPDNVGGRTRAILFDKDTPSRMYAGGVSGGLWISNNGGITWFKNGSQVDLSDNLAVSCITQAANGDIYFGTGEGFANSGGYGGGYGCTSFIGKGIWKSTDGNTFKRLNSTIPKTVPGVLDTNNMNVLWAFVNELAVHPTNSDKIWAGMNTDLMVSNDGGTTWAWQGTYLTPTVEAHGNCSDVQVSSEGTIIAVIANKPFLALPGESILLNIETAFPGYKAGRMEFSFSPSDPNYVWCSSVKGNGALNNIYMSNNKGQTWTIVVPGGNANYDPFWRGGDHSQGWYDNAIAVYPDDPEHVLVGGIDLWAWSGNTNIWDMIAIDVFPGNPYFVHVDHHTFAFHPNYGISGNKTFFIGCDGGLFASYTGGQTYQEMNTNYITTQFYGLGFSRDGAVAGGTQDNGNPYIDGTGNSPKSEVSNLPSGDGGYMEFSVINPEAFFWESQNGYAYRSPNRAADGGSTFTPASEGMWVTPFILWERFNDLSSTDSIEFIADQSYSAGNSIVIESKNNEYPFLYVTPTHLDINDTVMVQDIIQAKFFIGLGSGTWMTKEVLDFSTEKLQWYNLSSILTSVVCMANSNDADVLFVGQGGQLYRISGVLTVEQTNPVVVQIFSSGGQMITGIAVDPNNANNVVATYGNYGNTDHVYRSTNALGTSPTFTSIQCDLPPMPVYDVVIDKNDSNRIIIGTEYGIYGTDNGFTSNPDGVVWTDENTGMARVPTYRVRQQVHKNDLCTGVTNSGIIYIGTHGRGIFQCKNYADAPATVECDIPTGIDDNLASAFTPDINIYPNPVSQLADRTCNISFKLDEISDVTIKIYDLQGRVVKSIKPGKQTVGIHIISFNTGTLYAGTYFVSLTAGTFTEAAKFIVVK